MDTRFSSWILLLCGSIFAQERGELNLSNQEEKAMPVNIRTRDLKISGPLLLKFINYGIIAKQKDQSYRFRTFKENIMKKFAVKETSTVQNLVVNKTENHENVRNFKKNESAAENTTEATEYSQYDRVLKDSTTQIYDIETNKPLEIKYDELNITFEEKSKEYKDGEKNSNVSSLEQVKQSYTLRGGDYQVTEEPGDVIPSKVVNYDETFFHSGSQSQENKQGIEGDSSVESRNKITHERGKRSPGRKKWKKDDEFISNNITKKDDDSWPSLQDIFDQVHRNLSHWRKEEMIDYNWPYYYNFPTFETNILPTTEKPKIRAQEEDFMSKFVFRKIDTSSFKQSILAISVRNPPTSRKKQETKKQWVQVTTVPTPPNNHTRHLKRLHEHLKAISAAKARLHHRWLQKEKIQSKLLT